MADPVIMAAGDIACDPADPGYNGGAGTADRCHQQATSDLLVSTPLDAVLPLGDIQYDSASTARINAVYAARVGDLPPARSTFQVAKLPSGALVEIEAIAHR